MRRFYGSKPCLLLLSSIVFVMVGRSANARFTFANLINLGPNGPNDPNINTTSSEFSPSISADGLELYIESTRPGGYGTMDIWVTKRASVSEPWGEPENLGPIVNSMYLDGAPSISADGLELYFYSQRPGGPGGASNLWVTRRATPDANWGEPECLPWPVNSYTSNVEPHISANGLELYFASYGSPGLFDLWVTQRPTQDANWGEPSELGSIVNTSYTDNGPCISADGLLLFFWSSRPGGYGDVDIWVTRRASVSDPWEQPENLGHPINSIYRDVGPCISSDASTLYFHSDRPGGHGAHDLWQATMLPVVDLNWDGNVDFKDFCILAQYWKQDKAEADISHIPHGDGQVDYRDLAVLVDHWLQNAEIPPVLPGQARNPSPIDGARDVSPVVDLSWTLGSYATSHDVYFGTDNPPPFMGNQATTTFDPGTMLTLTKYYWRIDERNALGKTTGTLWSFTTGGPPPP